MSTSDTDEMSGTAESLETAPTSPTTVIVDPDGDLVLRVGSARTAEITDFRVCSATLRRASPVLKAMLFGPWIESKTRRESESQWEVTLPEDEPSGMGVILDIFHGNFDAVPASLETFTLFALVVAADKYDMFRCLRPFAASWREETAQVLADGRIAPRLVYVARVFGDELSYVNGLRRLIMYSCLTAKRLDPGIPEDAGEGTILFRSNVSAVVIGVPPSTLWHWGLSDLAGG
jgi:hypothetical protein